MQKQFLCGSKYFFKEYEDYKIHDTDYTIIDDELEVDYKHIYDRVNKIDYYIWKKNKSNWFIERLLNPRTFAFDLVALLFPDVAKELEITIEQLKRVSSVFDRFKQHVGERYEYYRIIYESYIENNDFILTQEQRDRAYESYKQSRQEDSQFI